MSTNQNVIEFADSHELTHHAWSRMCARSLSPDMVSRVLNCGRVVHIRGATIYAVGRKEIKRFRNKSIDLSDVEGVQVVCSTSGGIMTVYRNRNFRGLRPRLRRPYRRSK